MRILFLSLYLLLGTILTAQEKKAFRIFDSKGASTSYDTLLREVRQAEILFFGELHNNPIAHWLQYELLVDYHRTEDATIVLGMEMFEADNQLIIDEYVQELISQKNFEDEARLWSNYETDYKPLVEYARQNRIPVIATNVPRRYANLVFREGLPALDSLPEASGRFMAPLPIEVDMELPSYQNMLQMMGSGHGGGERLVQAQALKDATMAHFIRENLPETGLFYHLNGSYHSDQREGIVWYLRQYGSQLKILTITTVEQEDIDTLKDQHRGKADFIICVPGSMTKTY